MQPAKRKRTEKGLTLIECLMGILVITLVIAAITPPLLVAFATRVRNFRVENAMKAAQGEIDRVRLVIDTGDYTNLTQNIPPCVNATCADTTANYNLDNVPPPAPNANLLTCPLVNTTGTLSTNWCYVDLNGNNQWDWGDLAVQTFRTPTPQPVLDNTGQRPLAFVMGVRVYTQAALTATPSLINLAQPPIKAASLGLTSGKSVSHPIVVRYETIVRSDLDISKYNYCVLSWRLSGGTGTNPPCSN
ncbi:type II secretion system protein [Kamptonema formosum]|uniref:type II secretion system protein n=1 Tax=Kamptonema formosum TaxID=331992 RepID=UPI00034C18B8|nr:type II secretion system protein [Oscillatoria sp. PCC 10802]